MNSMTKKIAIFVSASAIVTLALVAVIFGKNGHIKTLEQTIVEKDLVINEERALREDAEAKLQVYKDSVVLLAAENEALHLKINELKGTISKLNKIIQKHDDKVVALTAEINRLKEGGKRNVDKIKVLEQEREERLIEMEKIDKERNALLLEKQNRELQQQHKESELKKQESFVQQQEKEMDKQDPAPLVAPAPINQSPSSPNVVSEVKPSEALQAAIATRQQERLNNVLHKTAVKFKSISLRHREGSNDLKKIKDEDSWRYTFIDLDLDNIDKEAIMDEEFIIQLYDLDKNLVVPYNERNMAFPNSEMGAIGYKFKYEGKPVHIRYINTQPKEGRNYELRLVYFKDDMTFKLANGTKQIVVDGKVTVD